MTKIRFNAILNIDTSKIKDVAWVNAPSTCIDCLSFEDTPEETVVYKIVVYTENGCKAIDEKLVTVNDGNNVFVSNAFSPNGDGTNDKVMISTSIAIETIFDFNIYDRWGNHVFGLKNINGGDKIETWDGNFNGSEMNPAVFVYFIKYQLKDGTTHLKKGDITLIR